MSDKRYKNGNISIILNEKDTNVNDPSQVAEIFNYFFTNVASGIGFDDTIVSAADAIRKHKEHSRVEQIRHEFGEINGEFDFRPVTVDLIMQNINNINPKKATGYDNYPIKIKKKYISIKRTICADIQSNEYLYCNENLSNTV